MAAEILSSSKMPVVELRELGVHHTGEPTQQEWQRVTRELEHALSETGFAFLTQHGLPGDLVNDALSSAVSFFELEMEAKMRWSYIHCEDFTGYLKDNEDRFSRETQDLKESFLFMPGDYSSLNKEPPSFKTTVEPLHDLIQILSKRLMTTFSLSLGKPPDYFGKMHVNSGTDSYYRFNYYPGTTEGRKDVTGFGAHTDFATFTLLLSNDTGGLQVRDSAGRWLDVPILPGTVLLMVGELLSFYSNKRFKAPVHRVVLPSKLQPGRRPRCSLIIFTKADEHVPMWPPSDDPTKPLPPTAREYLQKKLQDGRPAG